jgi:hypothetical protein
MNVQAEKSNLAIVDQIIAIQATGEEKPRISYISDSYQKVLDYHIAEIFLTTVVFGVIVLLRLHH